MSLFNPMPVLPCPVLTGDPTDVDAVIGALASSTECGATVTPWGGHYGGSGILVALPEYASVPASADQVSYEHIAAWVRETAPAVTAKAGRYFGAWIDGDLLHLDVVEHFSDIDEDLAITAGRARGQLAVYHAGRHQVIRLNSEKG